MCQYVRNLSLEVAIISLILYLSLHFLVEKCMNICILVVFVSFDVLQFINNESVVFIKVAQVCTRVLFKR